MSHRQGTILLALALACAAIATATPPATAQRSAQAAPARVSLDAGAPPPAFVGWPPTLPRPDGMRDVQYPFHDPSPVHIGASACSQRCVIEFSVEGDKDRIWLEWLAALPQRGWVVTDERAAQGTLWAMLQSTAAPLERFHVALTGIDGGGRGELRRAAPSGSVFAAPVRCEPVPEVGRQRVRAVAWSFDLDRDGLLDAAVYVDGGWTLYEVRRACARRVGRPAGTLVRLADEVIGPEGWVDVETDTFEGFGHTRRAWAFRRDEYAEVLPDAGVR